MKCHGDLHMEASSVSSSYTGNMVNAKKLFDAITCLGRAMHGQSKKSVKKSVFFWEKEKKAKRKCFISHGTFMILDAV